MARNQRGSQRKESNYISFLVDEALKEIVSPVEIRSSSETNRNSLEQICCVPQNTTDILNVNTNNSIPPTGYQYAVQDQVPFISTPINQNAPGFSNETLLLLPKPQTDSNIGGFGSPVTYVSPGSTNVTTESQVVPVSLFFNPSVVNQAQPTVSYRINHPLNSPVEIPTDTQHFNNTIHVQSNFDGSDRFAIIPKSDIVSDLSNEQILDKVTGKYRNSKQIAEPDCEIVQVDGVHGFQNTFMKTISRPISAVERNILTNNTRQTAPIDVTRDRNYRPAVQSYGTLLTNPGSDFAFTIDNPGTKGMHRAANFQCDICGANQESQAALKVHKAIHNIGQQMETCEPNMELICGECGLIFHNSKKLIHHMQNTHASLLKLKTTVTDITSDIDDECVISRQKADNDYFTNFMIAEKKKITPEMEQEVMKETGSNEKQVQLTKPHGGAKITKKGTGNRQKSKISSSGNQANSNIGRLMAGKSRQQSLRNSGENANSNIGRLMAGKSRQQSLRNSGENANSNIGRLMAGKSRQQSLRNSGENNGNGTTTGTSARRANKKSSKEKKKVQSKKIEIMNNSEHDSDIEIIEEPIEVIVLDDSPVKELDEFKDLLTYKYDADIDSCKSLKDTKANDRKLMEKYGLKDISIKLDKETPNKKLLPNFEGLHLKTLPKAAPGTHKIANLSDIQSSDLDKLLKECGMGTKVAAPSGDVLCDSSRREDSPQPGTSKQGSDNDYRPVKQPLAHISPKDQILLAKYGIKESKVLVPVVKENDTAKIPSPKLKLDVQPKAKPSWLSNNFDSEVSSDIELDIPSPDVDANNDEGYDADTDSCNLSVRNVGNTINNAKKVELNFGKVQTEVEVPLVHVPPKTSDEILLEKFGIKNAIVIMGTKDVCQKDTLKSHTTTQQVPKPTENKTCYKKAWQASDIKRTGNRTASHLDAHGDQPKHTPICPSETVSANEPPRKKIKAARNRVSEMIGQKKLDSCYTGLTEEELFIKYDIKLCEVLVEQESVVAVSSDVKSTETKFKEPRALRSSPRTPSNMAGTALIDKEANCEKRSVAATESEIPAKKPCLRQRNNSNNKDENTCNIKYQTNVHSNLAKKVSEPNKEITGRKNQRHRSRASTLLAIAKSPEIKKSVRTKDTTNKSSMKDNSNKEREDLIVIDLTESDDNIHLKPKSSPTRRKTKSVTNAIKTLNKASDNARPKENKTQLKPSALKVKKALRSGGCNLPDDNGIHLKSKRSSTREKKMSVISANDTLIKASVNAEPKKRNSTANVIKTLPAVVRLNKTNKSVMKPNQPGTVKDQLPKTGEVVISKCDEYVKNTAGSAISKPFIKELRQETDVKIVVENLTEDAISKMKEEVKKDFTPTKQSKLNSDLEIDGGSSRKKDLMCLTNPVVNIVRLKLDDVKKHIQSTSTTITKASAGAECSYNNMHDVEVILNELVNSVVEKYIFQDNVHKSNVDITNGGNTDFEKRPNATEKISKMEIEDVEKNEAYTCIVTESTGVVDQNDEEVRVMNSCNTISGWHDGKPNDDVDLRVNKDNDVAFKTEIEHSNADINMINETSECDDIVHHNDSNETDDENKTSVRSLESTIVEDSSGEISESLEAEISGIIDNYITDSDTNTSGGNVEKTTCTSPLSQGIVVNGSDGSVCGEFTVNEVKDTETHQTDTEVLQQSGEVKSREVCIDSTITCIDDEIHVLSENG